MKLIFPQHKIFSTILATALMISTSVSVLAQAPELGGLLPSGGPKGATTQVRIDGKNLSDAKLFVSGTGVSVKSMAVAPTGDFITADIAVESDARPGPREVRLVTPKGITGGARFWVDRLPNRVLSQPMTDAMPPLELDGTTAVVINGRILNKSGRDRFVFNAKAGETWTFDCYADRIRSRFDPVLEIRDESGVTQRLVQSTWESDPHFYHEFKKAGKYFLTVRDSEYNGGTNYTYRLLAGKFPLVTGFLPLGGQPGQTLPLTLEGAILPTKLIPTTIPTDAEPGTIWTEIPGVGATVPLLVDREPVLTAGYASAGMTISSFPAMLDGQFQQMPRTRFSFHGKAGQRYHFDLLGRRIGSRIDGMVRLLDKAGKELASNDDAPGLGKEARLEWTAPGEGDYTVEVSNVEEVTGPNCFYRLMAKEVKPDFEISIQTDRLVVPRGNTIEVPLKLERIGGYDGPVYIRIEGVPFGIQGRGGVIAPGRNELMLTLTAEQATDFAAGGIRIVGEAMIGGRSVVRTAPGWERYEHRSIDLILSVEYSYVRPHHLWDMLLASVTDANNPISVVLDRTDVTLEPGGTAEVLVHVARDAKASGPITLEVRDLPKKVTASLVQIPVNGTEGKLTLTAAPDAAPDMTNLILQAKQNNSIAVAPAVHVAVVQP